MAINRRNRLYHARRFAVHGRLVWQTRAGAPQVPRAQRLELIANVPPLCVYRHGSLLAINREGLSS
jgi:hypothetical protein